MITDRYNLKPHREASVKLQESDKSMVVTATMGFGWRYILSGFLDDFKGSKMLITKRVLIEGMYKKELTDPSILMITPEKLAREDITQYTPDLLVVDWPKGNSGRITKWDRIIMQVAKQAKRVIFKVDMYSPTTNMHEFNITMLEEQFNFLYGIKELECSQ